MSENTNTTEVQKARIVMSNQNRYKTPETLLKPTVGVFGLWGNYGSVPPHDGMPCKSYHDFLNVFGHLIEKCEMYFGNHEDKFDGQTFSLIVHLKPRYKYFNYLTGEVTSSFWVSAVEESRIWWQCVEIMHEGAVFFTEQSDINEFYGAYLQKRKQQHIDNMAAWENLCINATW